MLSVFYALRSIFVPVRAFQAMFAACFAGQLNTVTKLLTKAATNIHMTTKMGRSLLHVAAFRGHFLCVNFLLAQGVDAKLEDRNGKSALSLAAENNHTKVEKRIWLFVWNMDVLDELKIANDEDKRRREAVEFTEEAQRCRNMYDNTRLPLIQQTSKTVAKESN